MYSLRQAGSWWLAILFFLGVAVPHALGQAPQAGERIVAVRLVSESASVIEENLATLPVKPGQPFDSDLVRESLRQLYQTGEFSDIRVEATEVEGGVRLDFIVRGNLFINIVRVDGLNEPPTSQQAASALRLGLGEPFQQSQLEAGLVRLGEVLRNDGFYVPALHPVLTPYPATRQLDVAVHVIPGPRAKIGNVEVHNPTLYPALELLRRSKLKTGQSVTFARLDNATERLRKLLFKRGLLGARVIVHRGDYDAAANRLPIVLDIVSGPPVRVVVTGAKISKKDLQRIIPIYEEGAIDEDLLQEGRRNLRDYFERKGYFDSDVQFESREDPKGGRVITYTVQRGEHRRLEGIAFTGNHYFRDEVLRSRVTLLPESFLIPGRFSARLLRSDEETIQALYISNGFQAVKVHAEVLENYAGRPGDLFVRFTIEEGQQTVVESLSIEGNKAFDAKTLMSSIESTEGQPYSDANVSTDRDNILALYYNEGFPQVRFESTVQPGKTPREVHLAYHIVEGPRVNVSQILLAGYEHTREGTINREIEVQPGGPLRQGEVVDTQRRLYNLGIFTRVDIAPQNPDGTETEKTLVVAVEEAKRFTIGYGGGFETQRLASSTDPNATTISFSPRGIFELGWANFGGRAHTLAFKVRASTLQGRALLSYTAPNLMGRRTLSFQLTGLAAKTRDIRTFTSTRYEAVAQIEQKHSPITSFLYRYFYRKVQVDAKSLHIDPSQVPLFSQPTGIAGLGVTWVRDRRDNPVDPLKGRFWTADVALAARALGSRATFARFFFQNSSFTPIKKNLTFARTSRIGIEEPFGGSSASDIPLPERYFAGGGSSLRGFALNQAGPRDTVTGFPVGGLVLLAMNQELRFPLRLPYTNGHAGGAFFYDVGNVYSDVRKITLRSTPPPNDLNYLSHTIGVGIRYATPIGPVRVDFAYQLNPARFSLPTAPGGLARIPSFQFFFSFGSGF
ncbi:MAG: BamA/TamA family outer membrane protein [Acidipila sp.]|nr:BamA/TamA family outer membrane protein [Acidipila sp.]